MLCPSGQPKLMISPQSPHRVREGELVYMECVADGDPTPNVHWESPRGTSTFDASAPLGSRPGAAQLQINSVTTRDAGSYVCVADNGVERMRETFELIGKTTRTHDKGAHFLVGQLSLFNSLRPSDPIWWHRSGSTLPQVIACCLMATSHYLSKSWLIIGEVLWNSPEGSFAGQLDKLCFFVRPLSRNKLHTDCKLYHVFLLGK